jgi:hypothetical protein
LALHRSSRPIWIRGWRGRLRFGGLGVRAEYAGCVVATALVVVWLVLGGFFN